MPAISLIIEEAQRRSQNDGKRSTFWEVGSKAARVKSSQEVMHPCPAQSEHTRAWCSCSVASGASVGRLVPEAPEALLGKLCEVCLRQRTVARREASAPLHPQAGLGLWVCRGPGGHGVTSGEMPEGGGV